MAKTVKLSITSDVAAGNLSDVFVASDPRTGMQKISQFLEGAAGGTIGVTAEVDVYSVDPTGSTNEVTCATVEAGDTLTVANIVIAAVDGRVQTTVTTVADVAGDLNDTYFTYQSRDSILIDNYVWYNVDDTGTDPEIADSTGWEVAIEADDTADAVAAATRAVLAGDATITVTGATDEVIIQAVSAGVADAAEDGVAGTGFGFVEDNAGANIQEDEFQIGTDAESGINLAQAINGSTACGQLFTAEADEEIVTLTTIETGEITSFITASGSGGLSVANATFQGGSNGTIASSKTYTLGR
jgi:hypothetical protein